MSSPSSSSDDTGSPSESPTIPSAPVTSHPSISVPSHHDANDIRRKQGSLRLHPLGIHPSEMIGKVLKRVRRSSTHPTVTLHFADNTSFQIRVDGYNPMYPGIPKEIEMNPALEPIFSHPEGGERNLDFTISDATIITLTDRAFELREKETRWDQNHSGIAFKFQEEGKWHCIWVTLAEYEERGRCIFRSFDDVYLDRLDRPSKQRRHGRKSSRHEQAKGL